MAQPQISLKNRRRSCVDRLRVSTSRGAFEPSRLDDDQPSGPAETTTGPAPPTSTRTRYPPPVPVPLRPLNVTHVMNRTRPSPRFSPPFRIRVLYCQRKLKNRKNGVGLGTRLLGAVVYHTASDEKRGVGLGTRLRDCIPLTVSSIDRILSLRSIRLPFSR